MEDFYCPRCGKLASFSEAVFSRSYAARRLGALYFFCGYCRLIFISKKLVRDTVSEWWHSTGLDKKYPFKHFYNKVIEYLYSTVLDYHIKIGYKLARFKKTKP